MNRELKFRAWDKNCKVIHFMLEQSHKLPLPQPLHTYLENTERFDIMQFIGLQDKNGKDIYEGDILRFLDGKDKSNENGFDWEEDYSIGEVYWCSERNGWQVTNQVMTDDDTVWDEIEIIGNIYENHELLNSQK